MLIKEYHILLPMSLDEYQVAQLYMIQVRMVGRTETGAMLHGGVKKGNSQASGIVLLDPLQPVPLVGSVAHKGTERHPFWIFKQKGGTEGQKGKKSQRVLSIH